MSSAQNTLRSGTVDPAPSLGINGDFYINTVTRTMFGPKNSSTGWGTGYSLISSLAGNILHGSVVPPSNVGVEGDFYYDTSTSLFYGPKNLGVWEVIGKYPYFINRPFFPNPPSQSTPGCGTPKPKCGCGKPPVSPCGCKETVIEDPCGCGKQQASPCGCAKKSKCGCAGSSGGLFITQTGMSSNTQVMIMRILILVVIIAVIYAIVKYAKKKSS